MGGKWQNDVQREALATGETRTIQGRTRVLFDPDKFFGEWKAEGLGQFDEKLAKKRRQGLRMNLNEIRGIWDKIFHKHSTREWEFEGRKPNFLGGYMRQAINTPVQGGAADTVMMAMLRIHRNEEFKELGWKMC